MTFPRCGIGPKHRTREAHPALRMAPGEAAQMAREQGALFWELRIALSVARLRVSQGRMLSCGVGNHVDLRGLPGGAEGIRTSDLRSASARAPLARSGTRPALLHLPGAAPAARRSRRSRREPLGCLSPLRSRS
jgi:hypothetical protein